MNADELKAGMYSLKVKLCDPCLSALKWFVYHARRYASALLYLYNLRVSAYTPVINPDSSLTHTLQYVPWSVANMVIRQVKLMTQYVTVAATTISAWRMQKPCHNLQLQRF